MSETLITSTDPKGIRATSLFQAKYNKARLNGDQAQDLNEDREFWSGIEKLLEERTRSNEFANEEVRSSYAYPKEYKDRSPSRNRSRHSPRSLALTQPRRSSTRRVCPSFRAARKDGLPFLRSLRSHGNTFRTLPTRQSNTAGRCSSFTRKSRPRARSTTTARARSFPTVSGVMPAQSRSSL